MNVGVMTVELAIYEAQTLKDKRRVIHGLKQRIRQKFNMSVAEVAFHDTPKQCRLALAMVSVEVKGMHSQWDQAIELVRRTGGAVLLDYSRELY